MRNFCCALLQGILRAWAAKQIQSKPNTEKHVSIVYMGKKKGCVCHWTFAVTHHPANSRILSSTDFPSLSWNPYHLSGLRQCLLSIFHCFPVSDRPFQLRLKEHEGPHCLGKKCLISEHPGAISNLLWTLPVLCCEGAQMFFIAYWNTSTDSWTGIKRDRILKWRTHLTYRKTNQVEKKKNTSKDSFYSHTDFLNALLPH